MKTGLPLYKSTEVKVNGRVVWVLTWKPVKSKAQTDNQIKEKAA